MKAPREKNKPALTGRRAWAGAAGIWLVAGLVLGRPFPAGSAARPPAVRQRVAVAPGGCGFVLLPEKRPFIPWGFNYDRDHRSRLLEDYWDTEWDTVEADFREMKALGANVVRIHLQFPRFMEAPRRPRRAALDRLERLMELCDRLGLYLDVTGLACYRKADVPAWYDALGESQRWAAQASFWAAVARRGARHGCIFAYDLMNEPLLPEAALAPRAWLHPFALGGFHYVQYISLDPAGRSRPEIARAWIRRLAQAVRRADPGRLVTVGLLPNSLEDPARGSGFAPQTVARDLDYLSVHIYPNRGKLGEALDTLGGFQAGKPVVIEEMFPLGCDAEELGDFIQRSQGRAQGWLGFYWGQGPDELRGSKKIGDAMLLGWLELFQKLNPNRPAAE